LPHVADLRHVKDPKWRKNGVISAKLPDTILDQFHLPLQGSLELLKTWRHLEAKAMENYP
jgi:hypothetical protein